MTLRREGVFWRALGFFESTDEVIVSIGDVGRIKCETGNSDARAARARDAARAERTESERYTATAHEQNRLAREADEQAAQSQGKSTPRHEMRLGMHIWSSV